MARLKVGIHKRGIAGGFVNTKKKTIRTKGFSVAGGLGKWGRTRINFPRGKFTEGYDMRHTEYHVHPHIAFGTAVALAAGAGAGGAYFYRKSKKGKKTRVRKGKRR